MDAALLNLLCCPESHQPLRPASAAELAALNERIRAGTVRNHAGQPVSEALEAGLLREDGRVVYPVRRGLPILLIAESMAVE